MKKDNAKLVLFLKSEIESLNRVKAGKAEAAAHVDSLKAQLLSQDSDTLTETTAMTEQFDRVEAELLAQLATQNTAITAMKAELGALRAKTLRGVALRYRAAKNCAPRDSPPSHSIPMHAHTLALAAFGAFADAERAHLQAQTDESSERMGERDAQIDALQLKLNQLTDLFARMLQEVLDKLKERIEVANPTWQNRNIATISTKLSAMDIGVEADGDAWATCCCLLL